MGRRAVADWRTAKVHPDHHIACQYALYSVPSAICPPGQKVEVRLGSKLVRIYQRGRLIKVHPLQAGRNIAPGDAARSAGIRVFLYWLAVVIAAFLIPAAAGMWNAEDGDNIPGVTLGIVSLAYILFGIMHRPVLAAVGAGFAAAFYIPGYLLGDVAMLVSAALMLAIVALGAWWIRKSGVH